MVEAYKVFTDSEVKVSLVAATKNAYSNKVMQHCFANIQDTFTLRL